MKPRAALDITLNSVGAHSDSSDTPPTFSSLPFEVLRLALQMTILGETTAASCLAQTSRNMSTMMQPVTQKIDTILTEHRHHLTWVALLQTLEILAGVNPAEMNDKDQEVLMSGGHWPTTEGLDSVYKKLYPQLDTSSTCFKEKYRRLSNQFKLPYHRMIHSYNENENENENETAFQEILDALNSQDCILAALGIGFFVNNKMATALATVLKKNTSLISLNLCSNRINANGVKALALALRENKTLTWLNLSHNNEIHDDGAVALANALDKNTSLRFLGLFCCGISDDGKRALKKAAVKRKELGSNVNIDIGSPKNIEDVYTPPETIPSCCIL